MSDISEAVISDGDIFPSSQITGTRNLYAGQNNGIQSNFSRSCDELGLFCIVFLDAAFYK